MRRTRKRHMVPAATADNYLLGSCSLPISKLWLINWALEVAWRESRSCWLVESNYPGGGKAEKPGAGNGRIAQSCRTQVGEGKRKKRCKINNYKCVELFNVQKQVI